MLKERWSEIERLYLSASELESTERVAYLERMCGSDLDLRREVESLLEFLEPAPSEVPDTPVPSGEQIGPYTILEFLRAGGMGEVYKARDTRLDRNVAIKFFPSILADDAAALDRFRREARSASALNHPRICTVHDIGDYHGRRPFFVMELLEGQSLNERMSGKPVPIPELVGLAVQICDALQAAHAKGIIHRDIKPANVFLTTSGQIKILDFGLAKLVEESHSAATAVTMTEAEIIASAITRTRIGRLVGTPAYLSPEQARGEEVDARTDIFSFGLVLYEMATGYPTFRGQTSGELINAILHATPVKPSTLNPALSSSLERIILKALGKTRNARYQSVSELLHDLNEFQKAKQRRGVWMTRVAVAAATLVLSTAAVVWIFLSKSTVSEAPDIIQRQVTSNPVNDSVYMAAISGDGKQVAYTDLRGVHVRAFDTGEVYDISVPPGLCFRCANVSWFPGGTKLFISGPGGNGVTGIWTLATIGGEIRKIQDDIGEAALSPDGSRIVFEKQQELWQMGPNGENPVPLVQFPRGSQFAGHAGLSNWSDLAWSPDGRWLTYLRKIGETDPLVLEARLLEDGCTATILKDPDLQGYSWLSSTKIVLNRWETPDKPFSNLWHVDVDPKTMKAVAKPHRLTNWAGFAVLSMSATRDGNRLALTRKTDQSNILIGELADHGNFLSHLRRVSPQDRVEWPGGWSADGKALFFQSDRTGNMNIFRQRIDTANAEAVVMDQNDNRAPLLSPERAWVLYFAWPRSAAQVNNARLMRRPVGGGSSELILEAKGLPGSAQTSYRVVLPTMTGQPAFRCPSQSGPSCVLSEAGPHEVVFYSFAPQPGAGKAEVFRIEARDPNAIAWDLSPDGSRVAYAEFTWRSASIHVRELRTNTTRDIPLKGMTELSTLSWSADGKSFFATTFALTGSSLFHVTLDGKYRVLYKGAKEVEGARPSPDGRYLAFGDVVSASNVWLVEGFPR